MGIGFVYDSASVYYTYGWPAGGGCEDQRRLLDRRVVICARRRRDLSAIGIGLTGELGALVEHRCDSHASAEHASKATGHIYIKAINKVTIMSSYGDFDDIIDRTVTLKGIFYD